ncbi:hypothetical protein IGI39_000818 [Enterococcus sp. AZ135]
MVRIVTVITVVSLAGAGVLWKRKQNKLNSYKIV